MSWHGSGFEPSFCLTALTWSVAPGWSKTAPLALMISAQQRRFSAYRPPWQRNQCDKTVSTLPSVMDMFLVDRTATPDDRSQLLFFKRRDRQYKRVLLPLLGIVALAFGVTST